MNVSDEARDYLVDMTLKEVDFGARPLLRHMRRYIKNPLASLAKKGKDEGIAPADKVYITLRDRNGEKEFVYNRMDRKGRADMIVRPDTDYDEDDDDDPSDQELEDLEDMENDEEPDDDDGENEDK